MGDIDFIKKPSSHLLKEPTSLADNVIIQTPLSRRGIGPGLLILLPNSYEHSSPATSKKTLDPEPLQKWAEEGFAVVQVRVTNAEVAKEGCKIGIKALKESPECASFEQIGVIVYDLELGQDNFQTTALYQYLSNTPEIAAITLFTTQPPIATTTTTPNSISTSTSPPLLLHTTTPLASSNPTPNITIHTYPSVSSPSFILPNHKDYAAGPASLAHTRTLQFLKSHLSGPFFNLEAIWDEHCGYEFGERSVENTMATMVEEPYVNHVPTMTGGIGRAALTAFYRDHFIFSNPADTALELLSRTVGVDRVIDEFVFCFTHDKFIDWLVPGIPPTHLPVRIPFTSVVNIRGDCLYHEHIAWDQASVLRQLGLLPTYLPYPYPLPDGRAPAPGKRFEYRVPAAGAETARKMVDENAVESNAMLGEGWEVREVDDV